MNNFLNIAKIDRRKARIYTGAIMFLFFLILIFVPFFSYQNPPPGQEGVMVNFGQIDAGTGSEAAVAEAPKKVEKQEDKTKAKPKPEPKPEKKPSKPKPKPKAEPKSEKKVTPIDEDVITARNEAIALQKQKEIEEAKERADKKAREDAIAKVEAAEEAKRQAEIAASQKAAEEAQRIAEAAAQKQKEADDFKKGLADAFGKGGGVGDGGKPGNQGVEDGSPNADALKGLNTGIGRIGGGLQGRGGKGPGIKDNSNKTGRVVVNVCIDASGRVSSVKFTQKGSTTADADLINLAIKNAEKWSFDAGLSDTTCGTITYDFKVK